MKLAEAVADRTFRGRLIDALSARNHHVYGRSGHDQFFATFSAFGPAATRPAAMLAEVIARAGAQNIFYLCEGDLREDLTVRYLAQTIRTRRPEDDPVALDDYTRHMRAVGFAAAEAPRVGISLHAGELALASYRRSTCVFTFAKPSRSPARSASAMVRM